MDIDVFINGVDILFEAARQFKDLEFIDLGSGFKIAYTPEENATDIDILGEKLSDRFNDFCMDLKCLQTTIQPTVDNCQLPIKCSITKRDCSLTQSQFAT